VKLIFENWNVFLGEGKEHDALYSAMVTAAKDAGHGQKWWKLPYDDETREAYRRYKASQPGIGAGSAGSEPDPEDDGGWDCEGGQVEDAEGNCIDPGTTDSGRPPCDGCVLKAVYPAEDHRIPMSCVEYWWFSPHGERLEKATRHCGP